MAVKVLTEVPFELDINALIEVLQVIIPGSDDARALEELVQQARKVARPKAVYRESFIDAKTDESVTIDGVTFSSRALRRNLDKAERVFPYIATCGTELDRIALPSGDFMQGFWLDAIKAAVLVCCITHLNQHLDRTYRLGKTASMNPGSGDADVWPITQQKELFSLFGDVQGLVGVQLTDSCLMVPNKTISGIRFATEVDFRTCQVCHRAKCPSRSAAFDKATWEAIQRTQ
jgi:hypothetical protein